MLAKAVEIREPARGLELTLRRSQKAEYRSDVKRLTACAILDWGKGWVCRVISRVCGVPLCGLSGFEQVPRKNQV